MRCAWQAYINLLPLWMRPDVDKLGRDHLQELRLRMDRPPELIGKTGHAFSKETQPGKIWTTVSMLHPDILRGLRKQ